MQVMKRMSMVMGITLVPITLFFAYTYLKTNQPDIDLLRSSVDVAGVVTPEDNTSKEVVAAQKEKRKVEDLVADAVLFMETHPLSVALASFTHGKDYIEGDRYIFVYDINGICYASGQDASYTWKPFTSLAGEGGALAFKEMIKKVAEGGGWVSYRWRNATKFAYVRKVEKDGKLFIVGSGYQSYSKHDLVVDLVNRAVSYFNDVVITQGLPATEVFTTFSYPTGSFVLGDLYIYAVSFEGVMLANGDRPGLVGTNVLSATDEKGVFINQEIIKRLKNSDSGIWIEYWSKNAQKLTFAKKVTDKEGKNYFIACGYYPGQTPEKTVELVKTGYEYLKSHGLSISAREFNARKSNRFKSGDLYLFVYDPKGTLIAHGDNPDLVGINQWDLADEDGKLYVQQMIKKAQEGGGWVDYKLKNNFESAYVEEVDLGTDSFIIGSALYPVSKRETALLLVRSAANYLQTHSVLQSFEAFSDTNGKFIRGDLGVFVLDFNGIAYVWGDDYTLTLKNISNEVDDTGKPYVKAFINLLKQGPGQVTYTIDGAPRTALIETVEKDGNAYIVGVEYFN